MQSFKLFAAGVNVELPVTLKLDILNIAAFPVPHATKWVESSEKSTFISGLLKVADNVLLKLNGSYPLIKYTFALFAAIAK